MADNFFGFNTNFPSGNVLGKKGLDDEFLTHDVEEEYDALNDETFGQAANDDWEEAHEKLSELVIEKNDHRGNSVFDDSLLENDESQDEIVSKSISQLGLEDDLDDPAIMTVARNCSGRFRSFRSSSSPPPPAILETEDCGSPKTYSIWSRTPKDSGVSSLLKSLSHGSSGLVENDSLKSSTDNVFITPPKVWRAEELEKNLLPAANEHNTGETWPHVSPIMKVNQNMSNKLTSQLPSNLGQNQNKIAMDKMLTREEVERRMHSDARHHYPNIPNYVPPHLVPGLHPAMISPIGAPRINNLGAPNQSPPNLQMNPLRPPLLGNNCRMPDRYFVNTRMNMMLNQLPLRGPAMPNLPPGFNPSNMNLNHAKLLSLPPRSIAHPLLHKQFQFPPLVYNNVYNNYYENDDMDNSGYNIEDEYAGLMTQREKEWLIRIQLLQLKSENPHVEDYYFTTQVARRCQKKYSESANKGGGDAPELILPETTKHENRAFVPVQFEGSLGKLQAVSVNFPRKVLDITVTRPLEDDEGKVVSGSLRKYRGLLLDIEMFYRYLLEIEDEERRILAKPETEGGQHRENIAKMKSEIFSGLFNEASSEDYFQNVMTIRKGRSLVMRVFKIFNTEQQLSCLIHLFRCLSVILKKDQHDLILVQHTTMITDSIGSFSLPDLVQLGEALENTTSDGKGKDKNNFVAALKNKFGVSVICSLITRAEDLYGGFDLFDSDIQSRWAGIVLHVVECICTLQSSSVSTAVAPCSNNLLSHFQRFAVDREKFGLLQEKLALLETNSKTGIKVV